MKSYYSNCELLQSWSADFYFKANENLNDTRIEEVFAEMTQAALEDNLQKEMIVKYSTGITVYRNDLDIYSEYWEFFDFSVDKDTCEIVRLENGNVAIFNENGKQIEFVPIEKASGFDLRQCVDSNNYYHSNIKEFIECLYEVGIEKPELIGKAIEEYNRYYEPGKAEKPETEKPGNIEYMHIIEKHGNDDFSLAFVPVSGEEMNTFLMNHQTNGFSVRGGLNDIITELKTM